MNEKINDMNKHNVYENIELSIFQNIYRHLFQLSGGLKLYF